MKDLVGVGVFFILLAIVVFFVPTLGGLFLEAPNFEPANPLSTPEHIAPVWYFTPYYAILRAVPDQQLGALLMFLAVAAFIFLPWLDRSPVKSMRYRGWMSRTALAVFAVSFLALMYLGLQPAEGIYVLLARIFTVLYFAYFVLMPIYTRLERREAAAGKGDLSCARLTGLCASRVMLAGAAAGGADVGGGRAGRRPRTKATGIALRLHALEAENEVANIASLQRGARNFMGYCLGCHSLKYMRYSRMAEDLEIPPEQLEKYPAAPGRQAGGLHPDQHAGSGRGSLVRQGAAGSVAHRALARRGLPLPVPQDVLRRSDEADGRQQPAARRHGHAARALGARGREEGRCSGTSRRRARTASPTPSGYSRNSRPWCPGRLIAKPTTTRSFVIP